MKRWYTPVMITLLIAIGQSLTNAQCIRHVRHEVIDLVKLEDGNCFATIEVCIQKSLPSTHVINFQLNHTGGFMEEEYQVGHLDNRSVICHTFQLSTDCYLNLSLNAYGRTIKDEFCGVWSTLMALPVDLISWTGYKKGKEICFNWEVIEEYGMEYYEIESMTSLGFRKIGTVQAENVGSDGNDYQLCHVPQKDELGLFRLKMKNINGSFEYSDILAIQLAQNTRRNLQVYPNPASTIVYVSDYSGSLEIVNLNGELMAFKRGFEPGSIHVASWPAGQYLIRTSHGQTSSFVKQ